MTEKEIIQTFLDESKLKYTEGVDCFHLTTLKIDLPFSKDLNLTQMHWSMISMEIGVMKVRELIEELEMSGSGAEIIEFKKAQNES